MASRLPVWTACSSSAVRCTLKTASARDSVAGSTPRAFVGGQADARRRDHDADARRPGAGDAGDAARALAARGEPAEDRGADVVGMPFERGGGVEQPARSPSSPLRSEQSACTRRRPATIAAALLPRPACTGIVAADRERRATAGVTRRRRASSAIAVAIAFSPAGAPPSNVKRRCPAPSSVDAEHVDVEVDLQRQAQRVEAGAEVRGRARHPQPQPARAIDRGAGHGHQSTIGRHTGRSTWKSSGAISSMAPIDHFATGRFERDHEGQRVLRPAAFLQHGVDVEVVARQGVGERGDDARLVAHDEAEVVRRGALRFDGGRPIVGDLAEPAGRRRVPRDREHVGEDRDRRRIAAGAAAEEAGLASRARRAVSTRFSEPRTRDSTEPFLTSAGSTAASTDATPLPSSLCSTRETWRIV